MNFYRINLWDPATPSFISSIIPYVGTKKEIVEFVKNGSLYEDLEKWSNGQKTDTNEVFLPKKTEKLKVKQFKIDEERYFEHLNVWECGYNMFYKKLEGRFVYYKFEDKYYRAFYIDNVEGLSYVISGDELRLYTNLSENVDKVYHALDDNGWGNKNIIITNALSVDKHYFSETNSLDHTLKSILGYTDKVFDTEEEMEKDYANPEELHLELFINDYFADG